MLRNVRTFDEHEEWNLVVDETLNGEWGERTICDFVTVSITKDVISIVRNQVTEIIQR